MFKILKDFSCILPAIVDNINRMKVAGATIRNETQARLALLASAANVSRACTFVGIE